MSLIQLQHDKRLAYSSINELPFVPKEILQLLKENTLISFRSAGQTKPTQVRKNLTACSRYLDLPKSDLVFYGVETDSPLAPLIFWDAAHALPIGATITVYEDVKISHYLQRTYFKNALQLEVSDHEKLIFRKVAHLLADQDAGLDRFSFCIPTGPGDATGLNVVVKRILELAIPEKEIILCGRPDKNFLYWDHVRIIGEGIPAPPVWITKKKNELAKAAKYENLCILHDRVFLPLNFHAAIKAFGDCYSFLGFQSLWFDDRLNLSPVRYSDYGCASEKKPPLITLNGQGQPSSFRKNLFPAIEKQNFKNANPLRYQPGCYLTGSLYIVKRNVWLHTSQDESLFWAEFEDIEQAERCDHAGIPHRIVPGAFTQSLFARPILYSAGYSSYFSANGSMHLTRTVYPLLDSYLKPLIKFSVKEARLRLAIFNHKYHIDNAKSTDLLSNIFYAIFAATFAFNEKSVRQFIDDVEKYLLCDQLGYGAKEWLVAQFLKHKVEAKINLTRHFKELAFQYSQRPKKRRFYHSILEYFPKNSWGIRLGTFISALRLHKRNGDFFYHPKGLLGYYQSILLSTPFIDYVEKDA